MSRYLPCTSPRSNNSTECREISSKNFDRLFFLMKPAKRISVPLHGTRSPVRKPVTILRTSKTRFLYAILHQTQRPISPKLFHDFKSFKKLLARTPCGNPSTKSSVEVFDSVHTYNSSPSLLSQVCNPELPSACTLLARLLCPTALLR
jgi:hypothetical protein